jgi:hypothetical protein
MEGFIVMAVLLGAYMFYKMYKKNQKANVEVATTATPTEGFINETRDLVLETLRELGCEYEEAEELKIYFVFQGEHFMIEADNDCYFINVYDLWWHHISTYCDVEEFAAMQKTINNINGYTNCTVLYTINKEAGMIGVHSKKNMLFVRQIPNLKGYLVSTLDDFFRVQRLVMTEIEKCKVTEEKQ